MKAGYFVFDGVDPTVRQKISELHSRLIPYGSVSRLGLGFMQNTYYRILPASGWLRCEAFSHGDNVIGFFTSAREEGSLFKSLGVWNFLKLGLGILFAVAQSPKRLFGVLELLRRSPPKEKIGAVELLSFGVDEKFRHFVDPSAGNRISTLLFERCLQSWKARGIEFAFGRVKTDNLPVLLFYKNYAVEIKPHPEDVTSYEIIFRLDKWQPQKPA